MTTSAIVSPEGKPLERPEHESQQGRGLEVPPAEVIRHAKPNCTRCSGRGKTTDGHPCSCAVVRFLREHRGKCRVNRRGVLAWVPEGEVYNVETAPAKAGPKPEDTNQQTTERLARLSSRISDEQGKVAEVMESFSGEVFAAEVLVQGAELEVEEVIWKRENLQTQCRAQIGEYRRLCSDLAKLEGEIQRKTSAIELMEQEVAIMRANEDIRSAAVQMHRESLESIKLRRARVLRPHEQRIESLEKRMRRLIYVNQLGGFEGIDRATAEEP
jgi:chromosome segregation ATPase